MSSVVAFSLGGVVQTVLAVAISGVLLAWLVVTALNQTAKTRRLINPVINYDVCGLVPIWTFFAPNPGDTDTHLLFRDRDERGRMTTWREVKLVERGHVVELWSPQRRINKAIVDVVHELTRPDPDTDVSVPGPHPVSKQRVLSFPYLLVLNYVSQLRGDFAAKERQFAIARTAGRAERSRPEVLFVSSFHRVDPVLT